MKKILCFILTTLCLLFSINTTANAKVARPGQEVIEIFYTITYNNYKVTYSMQVNQSDANSVTLLDYSSCFPDSPLPAGYEFLGWSTVENSTTVEYKALDTISLSDNIQLYAVFKQQNSGTTDKIEDGTGSFHINVSNYTIDLTNTNKILNNIFIIIVFTIIYCYFLNPLLKILQTKGDK